MILSNRMKFAIQSLKSKLDPAGDLHAALVELENDRIPQAFGDVSHDEEVLGIVKAWTYTFKDVYTDKEYGDLTKTLAEIRNEFILLIALPGMFHALVTLPGQFSIDKIDAILSHFTTATDSLFYSELFSALWAASETFELSHEVVDCFVSLAVIKTFQFLASSSVIIEILKKNNTCFMQELYKAHSQFVPSSAHADSRPLFTKMTHLGDYTGLGAGVQYVMEHTDFDVGAYYDHASPQFKKLALVQAFMDKPEIKTSRYLAYLFAPERTEEELTLGAGKPPALLHCSATLIAELSTRYQHTLKEFSKPQLSDLDHKRMKRLRDLLKQIPVAEQAGLISPFLSLAILRCTKDTYANRNQLRTLFGGKGNVKRDFLQFIIQDFSRKIVNDQLVAEEVQVESQGAIWNAYVAAFRAQPKDMNAVNRWLQNDILVGYDTKEALSWLPEEYLQSIAKGTVLVPEGKTVKQSLAEAAAGELKEELISAEEFVYPIDHEKASPTSEGGLTSSGANMFSASSEAPVAKRSIFSFGGKEG